MVAENVADPPMTLTVPAVAEHLNLSESKTWDLVRTGQIPSFKIGWRRLVLRDVLQGWLRDQAVDDGIP